MNKPAVIAAFLASARQELATAERANQMALDEATSPESRPENKYDTRSLESSYLAAGQGERVLSLKRWVAFLETLEPVDSDRLGIGSLVELHGASGSAWFFLVPVGGGQKVSVEGVSIAAITAQSPLGSSLWGLEAGETVVVEGARPQEWEIVRVF